MHLLDVLQDQIDDVDLLEIVIAVIPYFVDAHHSVFEADRCYNSDDTIEEGDPV